ncbi:MAG: hypothetical protein U0457_18020 [Candidatus Sericytochromatia bacterium]
MGIESVKSTDLNRISTFNNSGQNSGSNSGFTQATTTNKVTPPKVQGDSGSINTGKGIVPSTGLFSSSKPEFVTKTELNINKFAGNKKELEAMQKILENFDPSKGINSLSSDDLNTLLNMGFDVTEENGQIVVNDEKGNKIDLNDLMKNKDDLVNTIKRTIAGNTTAKEIKTSDKPESQNQGQSGSIAPKKLTKEQEEAMLGAAQEVHDANVIANTVSVDTKAELEANIKAYDDMVSKAKKQTEKVDVSISSLLSLKDQAQVLIDKGKSQPLNDTEKKQLNSIIATMQIKQKELKSNQEASEVLLGQVNQAFSSIAPSLSESQKATANTMQSALQAKVSGQATTARQDFVLAISEEAAKLTAMMSPEEKQKFMSDPNMRMKALSPFNKLIDKMSTAKKASDFSKEEVDFMRDKLKIEVSEENGKVAFYHIDNKGKKDKVSAEDFKNFRTDLNNIVTSPELFTMATVTGQVALAYETPQKNNKEDESKNNLGASVGGKINFNSDNKLDSKKDTATSNNIAPKANLEDIDNKKANMVQRSELDKSIEKKREEEKYHNKQIEAIHERARETAKYVADKRSLSNEQIKQLNKDSEKTYFENKQAETILKEQVDKKKIENA